MLKEERESLGKLTPTHLLSHLVIVAASCIHADNPDHVYLNLGLRILPNFTILWPVVCGVLQFYSIYTALKCMPNANLSVGTFDPVTLSKKLGS